MIQLNEETSKVYSLEDYIEIISGQAPHSSSYNKEGKGILFLRVNNFGELFPSSSEYTSNPLKKCRKGDILVSVAGTLGEVNIADREYAITRSIFALRPKEKLLPEYLFFFLKSNKEQLESLGMGSAQKIITRKGIEKIKINIPSIEKQEEIIKIMKRLNNILFEKRGISNKFYSLIKSTYHKLFGSPTIENSEFEIKKLNEISNLGMGGTPSTKNIKYWENGKINWMKSGDIKNDFIYKIPQKITIEGFKNSNAKEYSKGDVVIALNGQGKTRGTTGILRTNTTSNQSVANISPKNKIYPEYIHFNLKYRYKEIRALTGDKERSGLNLTILRNFELPCPPVESQEKFSKFIKKIEPLFIENKNSENKILSLIKIANKQFFN